MRKVTGFLAAALIGGALLGTASAETLFDSGPSALTTSDPTQLGRLSRNGIVADWSSSEAYPGELNTTTAYRYTTYDIAISDTPYIQISIDSLSANLFASAYLDSYSPTSKETNYLGDAGSSGNYFGTDPIAFQVIVPAGHHLNRARQQHERVGCRGRR